MLLTRYGIREWMIITLAAAIPAAAGVFFGWWWLTAVAIVVWLALASFFRDPLGRKPASADPRDLVSPADGLVSAVLEVPEHPSTTGPATIDRLTAMEFRATPRPRRAGGQVRRTSAMLTAMMPAAPTPCTTRATISKGSDCATQPMREAIPHSAVPARYTRR